VAGVSTHQGVTVEAVPVAQVPDLVGRLHRPWIADEGPTDCGLRRGLDGQPLRMRGLAFDSTTTVVWDEDEGQVIRASSEPQPGVVARTSEVLVREREGWPERFIRTDYLRQGVLIASRYTWPERGGAGRGNAQT
jgi:hypothetical protein